MFYSVHWEEALIHLYFLYFITVVHLSIFTRPRKYYDWNSHPFSEKENPQNKVDLISQRTKSKPVDRSALSCHTTILFILSFSLFVCVRGASTKHQNDLNQSLEQICSIYCALHSGKVWWKMFYQAYQDTYSQKHRYTFHRCELCSYHCDIKLIWIKKFKKMHFLTKKLASKCMQWWNNRAHRSKLFLCMIQMKMYH